MSTTTEIEWTDATWNPVTGCTKITLGCDNCYAERFAERFRGVPGHPFENGFAMVSIDCKSQSDGEHSSWVSNNWFYIDKTGKKVAESKTPTE